MHLLIVDDEELELTVIERMVNREQTGITRIFQAGSMNQAIEVLKDQKIDILLTDIEMPKGSGHRLVEWVREQDMEIICIFLTSYAVFEYAKRALELKVSQYLLKPIEREELNGALRSAADQVNKIYEEKKEVNISEEEGEDAISKVQEYVRTHLNEELSRSELASQVYLHPDYLSHMFKEQTGMSLSEYIIQVRIEHAKKLLEGKEVCISEVAFASGYGNTAYFTKIFKRAEGMTPSEYRKRIKG